MIRYFLQLYFFDTPGDTPSPDYWKMEFEPVSSCSLKAIYKTLIMAVEIRNVFEYASEDT